MDDYVRPDYFVFAVNVHFLEVYTFPVEFNVDKKGLIAAEHRNNFFLEMVCKPVIDADLVQLARIVERVLFDRAVEQIAIFVQQPSERAKHPVANLLFQELLHTQLIHR